MSDTPDVNFFRINNACVLITMGDYTILTDPYFVDNWMIGIQEPFSLTPEELPPFDAIIGCHDVIDHWQMAGMKKYGHNKDDVQVFVAMESQVKPAKDAGFKNVEVLEWGQTRTIGELSIESAQTQKMLKWTCNAYVLRLGNRSFYFSSEARDIPPLHKYKEENGPVDVAVLPVNGVHMMGFYKLVMGGADAVEGTKALGAKTLFVIHDAHESWPGFLHVKSSGDDADAAVAGTDEPEVIRVDVGVPWSLGDSTPSQAA